MSAAVAPIMEAFQAKASSIKEEAERMGPLKFASAEMVKWGSYTLIGGALASIIGYFASKAGAAADADATKRIGSIANVFSNVGGAWQQGSDLGAWLGGKPITTIQVLPANGAISPPFIADSVAGFSSFTPAADRAFQLLVTILGPGGTPATDANGVTWNNYAVFFDPSPATGGHSLTPLGNIALPDGPNYTVQLTLLDGTALWNYNAFMLQWEVAMVLYNLGQGPNPGPAPPYPIQPFQVASGRYATVSINTDGLAAGFIVAPASQIVNPTTAPQGQAFVIQPGGTPGANGVPFVNVSPNVPEPTFGPPPPPRDTTPSVPILSPLFGGISAVATTMDDLPKALYATATNLPFLAADAFVWLTGWGIGNLLAEVGPWLMLLGGMLLVSGWALSRFGERLLARIELAANARSARFWNRFDKWLKTRSKIREVWTQKSTEGMIFSANAKPVFVPPTVEAKTPETPLTESPTEAPASVVVPEVSEPVPSPPDASPSIPEVGPASDKQPEAAPEAEKPVPGGATTAEVEAALGEAPKAAPPVPQPAPPEPTPEELKAQEAAREASMPPAPAPAVVEGAPMPTYREKKAVRDRKRSEAMLRDMEGAFTPKTDPAVKIKAGRYRGLEHPKIEPTSEELHAVADFVDGSDPKRRELYRDAAATTAEREERKAKKERLAAGDYSDMEKEWKEDQASRPFRHRKYRGFMEGADPAFYDNQAL